MERVVKKRTSRRLRRSPLGVALRTSVAFFVFLKDRLRDDFVFILYNSRLFFGIILFVTGVLSFSSGKYCDGNSSSYYACTRPSTYYYYEWWAIVFVILGVFSIVLWLLRKKNKFMK
jgi:hypothetical protein